MSKSITTADNIQKARELYLTHPEGFSDAQMGELLDVSRWTAHRYRIQLGAVETVTNSGRYTLDPTPEDVAFARAILKRAGYGVTVKEKIVEYEVTYRDREMYEADREAQKTDWDAWYYGDE